VVVVNDRSLFSALVHVRRLFNGTLAQVPGVSMIRTARVEIASSVPLSFHVDGEPHTGGTFVKACVHPGALRVRFPVG
jgi:diacylglycerol kinase family enzyme